LIRIAFQSDNLTLSQMKLARMLMVRKDGGYTAIDMLRHEQEGLDALVGFHCVFDSLSHVQATISCFQKNSIEGASYWKGAKKPFQVVAIHDLKHPAQRPLVNSVLEAEAANPLLAALHESGIGTTLTIEDVCSLVRCCGESRLHLLNVSSSRF
jgi:hypothetical protein